MKHIIIIEVKQGIVQQVFTTLPRDKASIYVIDRDGESTGDGADVTIEDAAIITKPAALEYIERARTKPVDK